MPTFRRRRRLPGSGLHAAILTAVLATPSIAAAQSAADKATARQAATEGIELYQAGKYDEALDRLRRAQQLFDAPVHLLYIARAQQKLGQLVEAAETYRLLARYPLAEDAPSAFVRAVEAGKKELDEVEPRIPTLEVTVEPEGTPVERFFIDGSEVATAVIGIGRPTNPGDHVLRVEAAGYAPVEQSVVLEEGEHESVTLTLRESAAAPLAVEEAPTSGVDAEADAPGKVGFMAGLRLGLTLPLGETVGDGNLSKMSDLVGPGLGFELRAGIRIAQLWTPLLWGEFHGLSAGEELSEGPLGNAVDSTATLTSGGLGLMVGTGRNVLGGFGEIGLSFRETLSIDVEGKNSTCKASWSLSAPALRIGGGANIPLAHFLHLTPFGMITLGRYARVDRSLEGDCPVAVNAFRPSGDIADADQKGHAVFVLGVGGDFVFGADRPIEK